MNRPMTKQEAEKKAIETAKLNGRPFKAVKVVYNQTGEEGWDVAPDNSERIKQVENELDRLIQEYYQLVQPTEDEIAATQQLVEDDARSWAEMLYDSGSWYGKLFLAGEAQEIRGEE